MTQVKNVNWEQVEKVNKLLSPFDYNKLQEKSSQEILKAMSIFDYRTIDGILEHGTEDEISKLINISAEEALTFAETFPADKIHQLQWGENKKKLLPTIEARIPLLFEKVHEFVRQYEIKSRLAKKISFLKGRTEGNVSAVLSTEEEVQKIKEQIYTHFDEIHAEIVAAEISEESKDNLKSESDIAKEEVLQYVDTKYAEEPTRILYFRTGNRVSVKVKTNNGKYSYHVGRGRELRMNRGEDARDYPVIVSAKYIDEFLGINKISNKDVWVDPQSVDRYYQFKNKISVNLTPSFVKEWYNYDLPDLYRHTPNKDHSKNIWGLLLSHWSNKLVEVSCSADYVDEDILESEAQALTADFPKTRLTRSISNLLKARKLEEEGKVEELKETVKAFENRIQAVIDGHKDEILDHIADSYPQLSSYQATGTDGGQFRVNDSQFGLDCGFLNIYTTDKGYTENRDMLRNLVSGEGAWMTLELPFFCQSVTVQQTQFNKVQEIVKRETGIVLYAETKLD